jgi:hypothetical protein
MFFCPTLINIEGLHDLLIGRLLNKYKTIRIDDEIFNNKMPIKNFYDIRLCS